MMNMELNLGQLLPFLEDLLMDASYGVREERSSTSSERSRLV